MNDLRTEFGRLASNGCLGYPEGREAYGYLRASSERQVEEGSSFPRQIENVHKAAERDNLRVPLDLVFFDDGFTGFEFEHRPALLKLRHEIHTSPRAAHLIIEDIDRLSRNADWQQGFLLEELSRRGIEVHFAIHPGSQLERYIRGYIAQEGMRKDIERMRMGNLYKAMDGRVTAKRPRYGYVITETRNSHYELHPEESRVMRSVYEKLVHEGWTLNWIAKWLNDEGIPTRFRTSFWTASTLHQLVKSPVYKGVFYANRHVQLKTGEFTQAGRPKRTNLQRPESEWIMVQVPPIVSADEWDLAQEALLRNAKRSQRNGKKRGWLLTGFVKCAVCRNFSFVGIVGNTKRNPRRYLGCSSRQSEKARKLGTSCRSPYVHADDLERRVWEEIEKVIYDPTLITERLRNRSGEERRRRHEEELAAIIAQLRDIQRQQQKVEAAYDRDVYTLEEFARRMQDLRRARRASEALKSRLEEESLATRSVEDQVAVVLGALGKLREQVDQARLERSLPQELPFDLKRRILTLLVDTIWVDSAGGTFTIDGVIRGTFAVEPGGGIAILLPGGCAVGDSFASTSGQRWQ